MSKIDLEKIKPMYEFPVVFPRIWIKLDIWWDLFWAWVDILTRKDLHDIFRIVEEKYIEEWKNLENSEYWSQLSQEQAEEVRIHLKEWREMVLNQPFYDGEK